MSKTLEKNRAEQGCGASLISLVHRLLMQFLFFPDVKPFRIQERAAGPRFLWLLVLLINMAACDQKSKTAVTLFDDFDSKQWRQEFAGGNVLSSVQGFEFDRAEIFMADTTNNRVLRLNANLEVVDQIGGAGQGPGEFNFPGPLYVSDG